MLGAIVERNEQLGRILRGSGRRTYDPDN